MTMAQVLEAIRGLGERFDTQDERLEALERETGISDDDPDDDDEAMKDPDDPDKDREGPPGRQVSRQ